MLALDQEDAEPHNDEDAQHHLESVVGESLVGQYLGHLKVLLVVHTLPFCGISEPPQPLKRLSSHQASVLGRNRLGSLLGALAATVISPPWSMSIVKIRE